MRKIILATLGVVALIVWSFVFIQITHAAKPVSTFPHAYHYDGSTVAAVWVLDNDKIYCAAGSLSNAVQFFAGQVQSLQQWTDDSFAEKFEAVTQTLPALNGRQNAACLALIAANPLDAWIVDQWRDYPTRPVYAITDTFPSVKTRIGDIAHSTRCGAKVADYSATITAYEWREVTASNGQQGTAVCRRK